ncbi:MAG: Calx-beta domain-containing protein [Idiomarina sp.]
MFRKTVLMSSLLIAFSASAQDVIKPFSYEIQLSPAPPTQDLVEIDLVVFYQPAYMQRLGGFEALYNRVNELISITNVIYSNSDSGLEFNIIELRAVTGIPEDQPFVEETDEDGNVIVKSSSTMFGSRLLNPDGYYDEDGSYQDNYPEHLVYTGFGGDIGMYITDYRDRSGEERLGAATQDGEVSAIADRIIINPNTQTTANVVAHELGHNLGAAHEEGAERSSASFDNARAYECGGKKTIMWSRTSDSASDNAMFFSSPNFIVGSEPCGESGYADNAEVLLQTKVSVSERRSRPASLGTVSFAESAYSSGENSGFAEIKLVRTGDLSAETSVALVAESDIGSTTTDLKDVYQRVTFAVGESEASAALEIVQDAKNEGSEDLSLSLVYPYKTTVSGGTATLTLTDDYTGQPGEPVVASDVSVEEGETATVSITRTNGLDGELVVYVRAVFAEDESNATNASSFDNIVERLVFADGEAEKSVQIGTIDDDEYTGPQVFSFRAEADGTVLSESLITVTDNEEPTVDYTLEVNSAVAGESVVVEVWRSGALGGTTSVGVVTVDGTLVAGTDFDSVSEAVTFYPNETSKEVEINLTGSSAGSFSVELSTGESYTVTVSEPVNSGEASKSASGAAIGPYLLMLLLFTLVPRVFRKRD